MEWSLPLFKSHFSWKSIGFCYWEVDPLKALKLKDSMAEECQIISMSFIGPKNHGWEFATLVTIELGASLRNLHFFLQFFLPLPDGCYRQVNVLKRICATQMIWDAWTRIEDHKLQFWRPRWERCAVETTKAIRLVLTFPCLAIVNMARKHPNLNLKIWDTEIICTRMIFHCQVKFLEGSHRT